MKKIYLLIICAFIATSSIAQESEPVKELGLTFRDLDEFGFTYRCGNENALWRFNTILLNGGKSDTESDISNDTESNNFGFNLSVGREYRESITESLQFRYGLDLFYGYNRTKGEILVDDEKHTDEHKTNSFGCKLVLGVNYPLSENLVLGAEVLPNLTYSKTKMDRDNPSGNSESETKGYSYGLSNKSVRLSLVYRF